MLAVPGDFSINTLVGPDALEFFVHGLLLKASSTFFAAPLKGPFREAREKTITLDDEDVEVFKTYLVWLYRQRLTMNDIRDHSTIAAESQKHIVRVYAFADKRGIPLLGDCSITLLAVSLISSEEVEPDTVCEAYRLLSSDSALCRALVRCELKVCSETLQEMDEEVMDKYPKAYLCHLIREAADHMAYGGLLWPSDNICYYHAHAEDDIAECRARLEDCA